MSEDDHLKLARQAEKYAMLRELREWLHQERTWGQWVVMLLAVYGFLSLVAEVWRWADLLDGW